MLHWPSERITSFNCQDSSHNEGRVFIFGGHPPSICCQLSIHQHWLPTIVAQLELHHSSIPISFYVALLLVVKGLQSILLTYRNPLKFLTHLRFSNIIPPSILSGLHGSFVSINLHMLEDARVGVSSSLAWKLPIFD